MNTSRPDTLPLRVPVHPHPSVIAQRISERAVLVHLETNQIYELNRTGARFWELLTAGHTPEQIQEIVLSEFDVHPEQLAQETKAFLSLLRADNLVLT